MQVGSVGAEAPVSVLSDDGDDPDTTGGDDGAEVVDEVIEAGVGTLAEILDRGAREAAAATGPTTDGTVTTPVLGVVGRALETSAAAFRGVSSGAAGSSSGGSGAAGTQGSGGLAEQPGSGGIGDTAVLRAEGGASLPSGAGLVPAALVDVAGSLPLTGISAWLLIAAGVWLLLSGLALLLALTLMKAPGRRGSVRDAASFPAPPLRPLSDGTSAGGAGSAGSRLAEAAGSAGCAPMDTDAVGEEGRIVLRMDP